jgi:hypothetical protein
MIDLDAIKKRHLDPERNRGRTYYEGHIEVDLAMLVEEVEHLREGRHIDNEQLARAWDESRDAERAAVVAWLRSEAEAAAQTYTGQAWVWASRVDNMADSIERGEHRKEEP